MQQQLEPFSGWIYLCSTRKRRWAKTSRDDLELLICKNSHPQSQQLGSFWLPQCTVRDAQQEHQQPYCMAIECVDGVSDVLVADDADGFMSLMRVIQTRGTLFHSVPSGGYAYHRHNMMIKDQWTLCWAVIEDQFLTLWNNKSDFNAAASSSSVGGMGGDIQPLLVLPLMCSTVIQCTDNVTASIDLHQGGKIVATHFLFLWSPASCAAWMTGFLKAVGFDSASTGTALSATPVIATLDLQFPQPHELVKTPAPSGMTLGAGEKVAPKPPKVLPDIVYGSAEQLAATAVPPLPEKESASWAPLPASELSKISEALGNPLEAIGSRISASLSWLKDRAPSFDRTDAAVDVANAGGGHVSGAPASSHSSVSQNTILASSVSDPESSAPTQRSGPTSQSLQSVHSIRHRQPTAAASEFASSAETEQLAAEAPHSLESGPQPANTGLLSTLPLPDCAFPDWPPLRVQAVGAHFMFCQLTLF